MVNKVTARNDMVRIETTKQSVLFCEAFICVNFGEIRAKWRGWQLLPTYIIINLFY